MFSNKDLRKLLIPLIIEQVLTSLMGTADTLMVSNVGSAALSGVSLVDSINKLLIFLFSALATGGTIVCSQYLGRKDNANANRSARQVVLSALSMSVIIAALCLIFRRGLLRLIFGTVEDSVMAAAETYFFITALTYPFLALFSAEASLYRAAGNSRLPMTISICSNCLNIIGNAILIFVFDMGVAGAAISTLISYIVSAVAILICQSRPGQVIEIGSLLRLRPDWKAMWTVLRVGIPTGVENSMFQFGKLLVQSTVSTLGTTAIAANAMVITLEGFTSMPSMAIGMGLTTVVGHCIGAGRLDEARKYIKKLTILSSVVLFFFNWIIFAVTEPVVRLAGMETDAAELTVQVLLVASIVKPILWPMAFVPLNGMRGAGDVKFGMVVSIVSMWVFRVLLTSLLCRVFTIGLIGIWCGYFADWTVRSVVFTLRYKSGKWAKFCVIDT